MVSNTRRMVKFIPILIQNSCSMKNNAPSLCDTLEQTIYPCNQCSEMACAYGLLLSPPRIYLHVPPAVLKGAEILCALHLHTHNCGYCLFVFFLFLHASSIAQSRLLDFPPHTHRHTHAHSPVLTGKRSAARKWEL